MSLINIKVAKITQEADGIKSFKLAKTGFFKLPKYTAGAHIDIHCGEGIIRQYSLCGDTEDRRHYMIAVKQGEPSRGGSDLMHEYVKEGDRLEIGSPRNNFELDETASHYTLIAGGIGVTPIIPMADRLQALGKSFEMHYFTRASELTAFEDRLQNGLYSDRVIFHQGLDADQTTKEFHAILDQPKASSQVYVCGPVPFMDSVENIALQKYPSDAIRLERFAANPVLAGLPTRAFSIKLARSGVTLEVGANETILEVLEENNIDAAFSCEQGVCGTCVTQILDGEADHRDSFLSVKQRSANTQMCLCVSRAKNETLVLDM